MGRVVHFEVHAENIDRAIKFYTDVFGWEFTNWPGVEYWMIKTGLATEPGIDGGLVRRRGPIDGQAVIAFVCTIDVKNVDIAAKSIVAQGGTLVVPKMPIPGIGWLAYGKDTEGNIFGFMHTDPTAK